MEKYEERFEANKYSRKISEIPKINLTIHFRELRGVTKEDELFYLEIRLKEHEKLKIELVLALNHNNSLNMTFVKYEEVDQFF
jgi:hypothetical protein